MGHREDGVTGAVLSGKCITQGGAANPRLADQSMRAWRSGEIAHPAMDHHRPRDILIGRGFRVLGLCGSQTRMDGWVRDSKRRISSWSGRYDD